MAVDPVRANEIAFTAPYVLIEGAYMVPAGSALRRVDEVDRDGVRIAVGQKSAYDLYLTRTIKRAALVRAPTSEAAIELFAATSSRSRPGCASRSCSSRQETRTCA